MRDHQIELINLAQLPVGVMVDQVVDHVTLNLEDNDILIMCSDGIIEQYGNIEQLKQTILYQVDKTPKVLAKSLLQLTVNKNKGKIKDDMMVLVVQYRRQSIVQAQYAS